jgi:uncharacterized RDD family membrane protein YckC
MKCPKCGYLGFEQVDRCRNCQYDFSLHSPVPEPDFAIRRDTETASPIGDLSLIDAASAWSGDRTSTDADTYLDRVFGAPEPEPARSMVAPMSLAAVAELPRPSPREELPLFGPPIPDDEPMITKASPPRSPLAVRRATPEVPRLRTEPILRTASFDLALDVDDPSPISIVLPEQRTGSSDTWHDDELIEDASVGARLLAVVLDLAILAAIDAVVIYFTMQLCYLTIDDLGVLPKGPLAAFLFVQNGGYLVAFTAGGQTLGKMMAGLRVVPVGLGFLSALFSRDHRGLHDRFAGTRVVRASV